MAELTANWTQQTYDATGEIVYNDTATTYDSVAAYYDGADPKKINNLKAKLIALGPIA